jgi:ATP-dependent exoDNAse (exonuclease V) beta subunit
MGLPALSGAPLVDADPLESADEGELAMKTEVAIAAGRSGDESGERLAAGSGALDTETLARIALPARLLPHQLAEKSHDPVRTVRHESSLDEPAPARERNGDEAINYGLWWHETVEFMPWTQGEEAAEAHCAKALAGAATLGFEERGKAELSLLRGSEAWRELRATRWSRLTELAVFAPLEESAWIDGVMDLVLHDAAAGEVWVLDWKTNRRRAGETDEQLLARLVEEYAPQLQAYGRCVQSFFPGQRTRLLVYASVAGKWAEVAAT